MKNKEIKIKDAILVKAIENKRKESEEVIQNKDKFEKLIQGVEEKIREFPVIGKYMSDIVCMVSLVRNYIKKEYTEVPIGTITSIVATLIYVVSPIDLIPDFIPVAGMIDDAALIVWVIKSIHDDVEKYKMWREENNLQLDEQL